MTSPKEAINLIHRVDLIDGQMPQIELDESKAQLIGADIRPNKPHDATSHQTSKPITFRYIFAIGGAPQAIREQASHELHDRILLFPTRYGIFPLYKTQEGTASLLLGVNKNTERQTFELVEPSRNRSILRRGKKPEVYTTEFAFTRFSEKDQAKIDEVRATLKGYTMLLVRAAVECKDPKDPIEVDKSRKDFLSTLEQAMSPVNYERTLQQQDIPLVGYFTASDVRFVFAGAINLSGKAIRSVGQLKSQLDSKGTLNKLGELEQGIGEQLIKIADVVRGQSNKSSSTAFDFQAWKLHKPQGSSLEARTEPSPPTR